MEKKIYGVVDRLNNAYKVALLGIALLATASCVALVRAINTQGDRSRIINISGRQRMLSQNIVKNILIQNGDFSPNVKERSLRELRANYTLWVRVHKALQEGDTSLSIPKQHLSPFIAGYFKQIEPYFNGIARICRNDLANSNSFKDSVAVLLHDEREFLSLMDAITFQFDHEAKEEVADLKKYELFFWLVTLISLVIEGLLIFRPISKLVYKNIRDNAVLNAEKRKRDLERLTAIMETQETERARIANDIHDGISPQLSLIKVNLSSLHSIQDYSILHTKIDASEKLIDNVISDVKNISYDLMPSTLSYFGLIPSLEELSEKMQHIGDFSFRVIKQTARQSFGEKMDINLYRIVQEFINNAVRHGKATSILMQLIQHDDMISVTLENNGFGFDSLAERKKNNGRGLKNIVSRVKTLDGSIQFDTLNNGKVAITIEIPLLLQN